VAPRATRCGPPAGAEPEPVRCNVPITDRTVNPILAPITARPGHLDRAPNAPDNPALRIGRLRARRIHRIDAEPRAKVGHFERIAARDHVQHGCEMAYFVYLMC